MKDIILRELDEMVLFSIKNKTEFESRINNIANSITDSKKKITDIHNTFGNGYMPWNRNTSLDIKDIIRYGYHIVYDTKNIFIPVYLYVFRYGNFNGLDKEYIDTLMSFMNGIDDYTKEYAIDFLYENSTFGKKYSTYMRMRN